MTARTGKSKLTPTQDLMLEVLAARARLGESAWTFDIRHMRVAIQLEGKGIVGWKSGVVQDTIMVWLTSEGQTETGLDKSYRSPILQTIELAYDKMSYAAERLVTDPSRDAADYALKMRKNFMKLLRGER